MNKKIVNICVLMLVTIPIIATASADELNLKTESTAPIITGPTKGTFGNVYEYSITYTDPEGEDVYYKIRWGDCIIIYNDGPHKSGETIKRSHAWCDLCCGPGEFTISVRARNDNGDLSDWGELRVKMEEKEDKPLYKPVFSTLFEKLLQRFPILGKISIF
ncbi:MAG: hypothetical protein JSV67_02995 [Thermoplasmatales archaeon]|nr:MAG: hypothetical protein JSV67_02995 [Thermoplasmatales archaeon]